MSLELRDYRNWLYRTAYGMTSDSNVDDIVQAGWVEAWRALAEYDPARGEPWPYVTVRARYKMLTAVARSGPVSEWHRTVNGVQVYPVAETPDRMQTDHADAVVRRVDLVRALGELPAAERTAIVGMDLLDLASEVVGEHMGLTPGRVYQLRRAGLARLKSAV